MKNVNIDTPFHLQQQPHQQPSKQQALAISKSPSSRYMHISIDSSVQTTTVHALEMSGTSTPNPRFQAQAKTTEDLLATQTVGLVNLSDFRKRRAEAIEAKERDAHESVINNASGRATPVGDGWVIWIHLFVFSLWTW